MNNGLTNGSHGSGLSGEIARIAKNIGNTIDIGGSNYYVIAYNPGLKMNPADFETIIIDEEELQHRINFIGRADVTIGDLLLRMCKIFSYPNNQLNAYGLIAKQIKILDDDSVMISFSSGECCSLYEFYQELNSYRPKYYHEPKLSIATLKKLLTGKGRVVNSPNSFTKRGA